MDNMAYLQQIAGNDNSLANNSKQGRGLPKFLNIWTMLGAGIFLVLLIIVMVIASSVNKVDEKDRNLMEESYWVAYYLTDETFDNYANLVKSSDIRNMTASFRSVLNEIMLSDKNVLLSEYGIEVDDLDEEKDDAPKNAKKDNDALNAILEDARLSGYLDRVYLREVTMQVAYLKANMSETSARTSNAAVKDFAAKAEMNLDDIYNQFHNFKSLAI